MLKEIKEVAKTGILPDGDHIGVATTMWLEDLLNNQKCSCQDAPTIECMYLKNGICMYK